MTTNHTNGSSGTAIAVVTVAQLHDRVARYRTAIVALIDLIKRDGGYRPTEDQHLVKQIERLIEEP